MTENRHNFEQNGKTKAFEYVTVAIAEDMELAEEYRQVLDKSSILAYLKAQRDGFSQLMGIAIMVPEEAAEAAVAIIESQQAFDDFLDIAFNETGDYDLYDYDEDSEVF